MMSLKLSLFGSPQLERDGALIPLRRRKAVALFAYLAVTQQAHSRDGLATLLWPDADQSSARTNLRRDLSWLNKTVGKGILSVSRAELGIQATAVFTFDITLFQNNLAQVRQHAHIDNTLCPDCVAALTTAVSLYTGDFMAGFTLPDTAAFADWQFFPNGEPAARAGLGFAAAHWLAARPRAVCRRSGKRPFVGQPRSTP